MKRLFVILTLLAVLFLVSTCSQPASSHEDLLYQVECFQQIMPDSALKVLEDLDTMLLSKKEIAHRNLLMAQSLYFLSQPPKVIDSLLDEARLGRRL